MPLVSRTFDQIIDFTRTSAGTFVGSNGLIQNTAASRNLMTFTQEFDNFFWAKLATTVTTNSTAAPDGTMTADTLTATASTNRHSIQMGGGLAAGVSPRTFSIYAKAGTHNFVQVYFDGDGDPWANFNLATGAVGSTGTNQTATITPVGNGWYRCVVATTSLTATGPAFVIVSDASAARAQDWTTAGTESVFIWGAQHEQAPTATDYTRNFGGVFPPRFDFDPVTLAPRGLLIEEQRTNLFTYSEQFDNADWPKQEVTVTANSTTSPDGTVDADTLIPTTTNTIIHRLFITTAIGAAAHSFSIYAKAAGYSWLKLRLSSGTRYANFNVSTGALGVAGAGVTSSITAVGNGWYRCTMTATTVGSETAFIYPMTTDNADVDPVSFAGDGTSGIFIWGAQLETGSFATSYIPTVASQVTRTADIATINAPNFAPWYRADEGTIVAEFLPISEGSFAVATAGASFANRMVVYSANSTQLFVETVAGAQASIDAGTIAVSANNKVAAAYRVNDFAVSLNGSAAATDGSGAVPTVNQFGIGSQFGAVDFLNGHIRSIRYYPVRLSNAQLQALTA